MAKPATDMNNNYIYIIEECNDDPNMPAQTEYRKIGILAENIDSNGPFHLRERALNQGNPRGVSVVFSFNVSDRKTALFFENKIHNLLKDLGYPSRFEETNKTGHSEWFKISREKAIEIIQQEYISLPKSMCDVDFMFESLFRGL